MKTIQTGTVADAYLAMLADRGIDYLFANAGTDFAPHHRGLRQGAGARTKVPEPVTVPHENVAIAMGAGLLLQDGRPQAVMVHVNVGTANAMCGLINGWRGNIPGAVHRRDARPIRKRAGFRAAQRIEIHWPQEMRDQRAMVREFVKWDYELPTAKCWNPPSTARSHRHERAEGLRVMTLPARMLAAPVKRFSLTPRPRATRRRRRLFPIEPRSRKPRTGWAGAELPMVITRAAAASKPMWKARSIAERFADSGVRDAKPKFMS
jgi:acetolactate synthase-1/2/3 large subunit